MSVSFSVQQNDSVIYMYVCISRLFPLIGYCKILSIAVYAIQLDLAIYLFYMW